jgi:hypothetical protein
MDFADRDLHARKLLESLASATRLSSRSFLPGIAQRIVSNGLRVAEISNGRHCPEMQINSSKEARS